MEIIETCRNCNKRRCRFRKNLPKKISKKQRYEEELLLRFVQLELFDYDELFKPDDC